MRGRILGAIVVFTLLAGGVVAASALDRAATSNAPAVRGETVPVTGEAIRFASVTMQQRKLNELFRGYGISALSVDGDAGPLTRQQLCAFRVAVGLPASTRRMEPNSAEERRLMNTTRLPTPSSTATQMSRWGLIDRTCQIMFVGARGGLRFVFPTSTGSAGYQTRLQDRTAVFKYNSASHNRGWHDSTLYPSSNDNPLNGNMYKPLYFDRGQAIHGATNVPTYPASKGCARLRVSHMDQLIGWLGLGGVTGILYGRSAINFAVNVQGRWAG